MEVASGVGVVAMSDVVFWERADQDDWDFVDEFGMELHALQRGFDVGFLFKFYEMGVVLVSTKYVSLPSFW